MKSCRVLNPFLLLIVYHISGIALTDPVEKDLLIREKRNLICLFGLTDIIKETLYASLLDARQEDPISLGDEWDGRLHDGLLRGLSTLTNLTSLKVFCNEDGIIIFSTTLRMKDAEIRYNWTRKVVFKFKGSVWVSAKEVDFDLEVRMNTTCGLNFEVTNSLVTKVDNFQTGFKGLGILNPIVKKILKRKWKKDVANKIGLLIKQSLTKKLGNISSSLDWMTFL